jgi:hypothetical protein
MERSSDMAIGQELQKGWAGQTKGYQPGSTRGLLSSIVDPLDLFSGRGAKRQLEDAQRLQQQAQMASIAEQQRQFQRGAEMMRPYREYGMRALPALTGSLQPGSRLGTMRAQLGAQYMPQALAGTGFGQDVIDELMGKYQTAMGVQESTARTRRAQDIMNLGMGAAVQGAGMAGQQGRSLADIYLQGAQQRGQFATQEALARRQQGMGAMYGGYRTLQDYLGGAYG